MCHSSTTFKQILPRGNQRGSPETSIKMPIKTSARKSDPGNLLKPARIVKGRRICADQMHKTHRWKITQTVSMILIIGATAAFADENKDDSLSLLTDATTYRLSKDAVACEKALYSKTSDQWLKAYMQGQNNEADLLWKKILVQVKDCESIDVLIDKLYYRVRFLPDESEEASARMAMVPFYTSLLNATEKAVGKDHRFCVQLIGYIAGHYEDIKNFKEAIVWRDKQLKVSQRVSGSKSHTVAHILFSEGRDYCSLRDYKNAEPLLLKSIAIAEKNRYPFILKNSLFAYGQLLCATNRKPQALALQAKYRGLLEKRSK